MDNLTTDQGSLPPNENNVTVPLQERKKNLEAAIIDAKSELKSASCRLLIQLLLWLLICIVMLIFSACFVEKHLWDLKDNPLFDKEWTWQLIYFTAIRITVLSAIITIIVFCFKLFRAYLFMYQNNREKRVLLALMPSLVEGSSPNSRSEVYNKMIQLLIKSTASEIIGKDREVNVGVEILDLLDKIKKTKD